MKHLFIRCNGGHYFRGTTACPWDGWSCDGVERARAIVDELGEEATAARLLERGVHDDLVRRLVIIEFGNETSAFDALAAERYIHRGKEMLAHEADATLF